jgi:hypothetical protein
VNCSHKTAYSKREALSMINAIMRGHRKNRPERLRAYHCPDCNQWHLTHGRNTSEGYQLKKVLNPRKIREQARIQELTNETEI